MLRTQTLLLTAVATFALPSIVTAQTDILNVEVPELFRQNSSESELDNASSDNDRASMNAIELSLSTLKNRNLELDSPQGSVVTLRSGDFYLPRVGLAYRRSVYRRGPNEFALKTALHFEYLKRKDSFSIAGTQLNDEQELYLFPVNFAFEWQRKLGTSPWAGFVSLDTLAVVGLLSDSFLLDSGFRSGFEIGGRIGLQWTRNQTHLGAAMALHHFNFENNRKLLGGLELALSQNF